MTNSPAPASARGALDRPSPDRPLWVLLPVLAVALAVAAVPVVLSGDGDGSWTFVYLAGITLVTSASVIPGTGAGVP